eukprot:gene1728-3346_t
MLVKFAYRVLFFVLPFSKSSYDYVRQNADPSLSRFFPMHYWSILSGPSRFPTWIVTPSNVSSIHRFFDSSPFSPSGKYLAITRMKEYSSNKSDLAHVIIIDLTTGIETVVASTRAWDSQVGAHVQWGKDDTQLFFNDMKPCTKKGFKRHPITTKSFCVFGILIDITTKNSQRIMNCPIYHITTDGSFGITSDLTKIGFTQKGYGVRSHDAEKNKNASTNDGFWLTNIKTGKCTLLLSLKDTMATLQKTGYNIDSSNTPTYGFHAKWSWNNTLLLVVVRTLERIDSISNLLLHRQHTVRRQHAFVLRADGTGLTHIVSWGSPHEKTITTSTTNRVSGSGSSSSSSSSHGGSVNIGDGNHPSWIPGTNRIAMNLAMDNKALYTHTHTTTTHSVSNNINNNDRSHGNGVNGGGKYHIVEFDLSTLVELTTPSSPSSPSTTTTTTDDDPIRPTAVELYPRGTGHPAFYTGGRYLVTDAYVKERGLFRDLPLGQVPLILIDTLRGEERLLLQLQTVSDADKVSFLRNHPNQHTGSGSLSMSKSSSRLGQGPWRCDMHPAWSRDFRWLAMNGRPGGNMRQVLVGFFGDDPEGYFLPPSLLSQ